MRILVTGCLGFIGSHFCRYMLNDPYNEIVGLARNSNQRNLMRIGDFKADPRFNLHFIDLDRDPLADAFQDVEVVVNFAAKTFVDYSIQDPLPFINSNLIGAFRMLEEARKSRSVRLFCQVSTDEVYGAILDGSYSEDSKLNPTNPYAATKAGSDMLTVSYFNTYKLPIIITRTENNYGPWQSREKVFPTFIRRALNNKPLPVYGDGKHSRMWLHVMDHCYAINHLIGKGKAGEIYHVAGDEELQNLELAKTILRLMKKPEDMIEFVPDHNIRPGHDRRYALDSSKIRATGWRPAYSIETGFASTVAWYCDHKWWFT